MNVKKQEGELSKKSLFVITFCILGLIYSIMLVGVYITSSHQGLSCLTWPLCPNGFGLPDAKHFFEHYHRTLVLVLMVTVFSFTATAILKTKNRKLKRKLILVSVLLIIQINLGWIMIATKLNPLVVASHLSTAVALFGIVLITLISLYKEIKDQNKSFTQ